MTNLSTQLWLPAFVALMRVPISAHNTYLIRTLNCLIAICAFLLACRMLSNFNASNSHLQFSEFSSLNPKLGRTYSLGIIDLLISMRELATLSITIALPGVFMAQNWTLFYIFWEVTLIPLLFLLGLSNIGVPGANGFITNG